MIDEYATDPHFKDVMSAIALGKKEEPFIVQDGYLLYGNRLCATQALREKIMFESHAPPCAGPRGIQATLKGKEMYFYWLTMKQDIPDYVSKCLVCQKTKYDRGKQAGYCSHCLFQTPYGKAYPWISSLDCLNPYMGTRVFGR